jgi:hypothetical protein
MTIKKAKAKQGREAPGAEIIFHPSSVPPSPFLEEINTVRLEGRYFAFDPKRANEKQVRQAFRDGERTLEIIVHPGYGRPSILAYRVLQHVFPKITKEGKPFPDVVSFSYRESGRLIGRDVFGGKDLRELERAIKQLKTPRWFCKRQASLSENRCKLLFDRIFSRHAVEPPRGSLGW